MACLSQLTAILAVKMGKILRRIELTKNSREMIETYSHKNTRQFWFNFNY